jgi:L-ribulose-5-phosphate 3-epimerase
MKTSDSTSEPSFGAFVNITEDDVDSWQRQFDQLQQLGDRRHIEIWLEDVAAVKKRMKEVVELFRGEQVIVHAPFVGLSLVSPWSDLRSISRERLIEAIDVAGELTARVFTVHPGEVPVMEPQEAVLDRAAESYTQLERRAGDMVVTLENMPDRRTAKREGIVSGRNFTELLDRIPTMKFTLDIGHALQNGDRYDLFLGNHAAAVANIHLHDGIKGGAGHLALGRGELNIDNFFSFIRAVNYQGFISLETLGFADTELSWKMVMDQRACVQTRALV